MLEGLSLIGVPRRELRVNHARVRQGKGFNDTLCVLCQGENNTFGSPAGCDKDIFEIDLCSG